MRVVGYGPPVTAAICSVLQVGFDRGLCEMRSINIYGNEDGLVAEGKRE